MRQKVEPKRRLPWVTLALLALSASIQAIALLGIDTLSHLALERQFPLDIWRWFSAHLTHTDGWHLAWNMLALALLSGTLEYFNRRRLILALVSGLILINAWFWWISTWQGYAGLSGILNTILVLLLYELGVTRRAAQQAGERWILLLVFCGAWLKALVEFSTDQRLVTPGLWPAAPGAHLAGLTAGCIVAFVSHLRPGQRRNNKRNNSHNTDNA